MIEEQKMIEVTINDLKQHIQTCYDERYRLVQIGCTKTSEGYEVNYSFDKNYKFVNYRIKLASNEEEIPSITGIYWNAFLYENELHDLFGLKIKGINVDFQGKLYKLAQPFPFSCGPEIKIVEKKEEKKNEQ